VQATPGARRPGYARQSFATARSEGRLCLRTGAVPERRQGALKRNVGRSYQARRSYQATGDRNRHLTIYVTLKMRLIRIWAEGYPQVRVAQAGRIAGPRLRIAILDVLDKRRELKIWSSSVQGYETQSDQWASLLCISSGQAMQSLSLSHMRAG